MDWLRTPAAAAVVLGLLVGCRANQPPPEPAADGSADEAPPTPEPAQPVAVPAAEVVIDHDVLLEPGGTLHLDGDLSAATLRDTVRSAAYEERRFSVDGEARVAFRLTSPFHDPFIEVRSADGALIAAGSYSMSGSDGTLVLDLLRGDYVIRASHDWPWEQVGTWQLVVHRAADDEALTRVTWETRENDGLGDGAQTACDVGNPLACFVAAGRLAPGPDGNVDVERQRAMLDGACTAGIVDACGAIALMDTWAAEDAATYATRLDALRARCDAGEVHLCVAWSGMIEQNAFDASNGREQADEVRDRACEAGARVACGWRGLDLVDHEDTREEGVRLVTRACDMGDAIGCQSLAVGYRDGDFVPQDMDRALALFTRACDLGGALSCALEADILHSMPPEEQPTSAIAELADYACTAGADLGCIVLGQLFYESDTEGDRELGIGLFDRACGMGSELGCGFAEAARAEP